MTERKEMDYKEGFPKLLREALALEEAQRRRIGNALATMRQQGRLPEDQKLEFGNALYLAVICTAISMDGGVTETTTAIKQAFGLSDDDIGYVLREVGDTTLAEHKEVAE